MLLCYVSTQLLRFSFALHKPVLLHATPAIFLLGNSRKQSNSVGNGFSLYSTAKHPYHSLAANEYCMCQYFCTQAKQLLMNDIRLLSWKQQEGVHRQLWYESKCHFIVAVPQSSTPDTKKRLGHGNARATQPTWLG